MKIHLNWIPNYGPVLEISFLKKNFFLFICHHMKERSIPFFGIENILCARCFGICLGVALGLTLFFLNLKLPLILSILFILPLLIDGFTQLFGLRISNNFLRLTTGILFSIGIIFLIQNI